MGGTVYLSETMYVCIYIYIWRERKRERERARGMYVCVYIYMCIYIYTHNVVTRSAAPPSPPLHGLWSRMPPLLWDGVWVPSSPCGVVVGVLGFWV